MSDERRMMNDEAPQAEDRGSRIEDQGAPLYGGPAVAVPLIGIIMGSDSDLPVMQQAAEILREFGVPFELTIVSAHRTPQRMVDYARAAHTRGLRAIIAGAGGAAHLPGMVAGLTPLPVIGVPIPLGPLGGQDALLSIVQMPRGVPVATVAIGNAANAGLLAVRILAAADLAVQRRMLDYQQALEQSVLDKAARLDTLGWEEYAKRKA
jgi:phosphoribosylaminoimidazole carboxylase